METGVEVEIADRAKTGARERIAAGRTSPTRATTGEAEETGARTPTGAAEKIAEAKAPEAFVPHGRDATSTPALPSLPVDGMPLASRKSCGIRDEAR